MRDTSESISVLHVDDEPDLAELTGDMLAREDDRFEVETATSASDGLDRLAGNDVDCIVSDYDMPGQNGIEFLKTVREEYPGLPFLLFTGKGSEEVASDAISAGVTDYIQKKRGTNQYTLLANRVKNAVFGYRSASEIERRQQRTEQILKTVPACVVQIDYDGQFVFANERAEEVLGMEPSDVSERTYNDPEWDIRGLDGTPIPDGELPFRQVRDSGEPLYGYHHTIEWPDGTRKALLVNGAPLCDDDGEVKSTIFALTDITEQIERRRELKQQEEVVRAMNDGAVIVQDGAIKYTNPRVSEIVGYTREELAGESMLAFIAREYRDVVGDRHRSRVADEVADLPEMYEIEVVSDDGERIPVEINVSRIAYEGEPATLSLVRDITERKRREQECAQIDILLSTLFETLPVGVTVLDTDGTITRANQRAEDVLGLTKSEITDRTYNDPKWEIVDADGESVPGGDLPFARVMETGEAVFNYEHGIKWPDGSERWLSINAAPLTVEADDTEQVVAVITDITEERDQKRTLRRQNERLEEFASIVSHDLRNPLNVASGRLALARDECDSDHLDVLDTALARMERIIDDVLWLAREGRDIGSLEAVAFREAVDSAWEIVADGADSAELRYSDDKRERHTIRADFDRLCQLLENVFRNAIEHGGADVTVTVGTLNDGFYVADDGPGIPEEDRDGIFDRGYSTSEEGTGFGLNIVEQVADAHGWETRVTDGPGGGARFEITGIDRADEPGR